MIAAYGEGSRVPITELRENEARTSARSHSLCTKNVFLKYTMKAVGTKTGGYQPGSDRPCAGAGFL